VDSSGKIYVADIFNGLSVYAALGSSTGSLNEAPIATIYGSNTGMEGPGGIAVDSSGKIYVTGPVLDAEGRLTGSEGVAVYAAGSNGNVAPIAAITGNNTGLISPSGIAVDSSGKIYVADVGPNGNGPGSVFVYAAGSNGNVAPIAAISGSNTGLEVPAPGIAVDSSGKIYVADDGPNGNGPGSVFVYAAGSNGSAAPIAAISGEQHRAIHSQKASRWIPAANSMWWMRDPTTWAPPACLSMRRGATATPPPSPPSARA